MKILPLRPAFVIAWRCSARVVVRRALRPCARKVVHLTQSGPGLIGTHDVQALAAGRLHEAVRGLAASSALSQPRARRSRRESSDARVGIEIEHDQVGLLEVVRDASPRCGSRAIPSCTRPNGPRRVEHSVARLPSFSRDRAAAEPRRTASPGCFWKKHGLSRPSGQRTSVSGRSAICGSMQLRHDRVVLDQLALRDALLGVEDAIGSACSWMPAIRSVGVVRGARGFPVLSFCGGLCLRVLDGPLFRC